MIYYVLLKGKGNGCDFTMGCNLNYKKLEATTKEAAILELPEIVDYYGGINYEGDWEEITLLEVNTELDLKSHVLNILLEN